MIESKSLKLKLGLCSLALTSFLALNSRSVVHADTVQNNNANQNAITWDSDSDDSQVVHEDSEQDKASCNVQTQAPAVQSSVQKQEAPATQSVQSNNQKRAETSAVRVSNFDTSTVNRLNANSVRNNQVTVSTVRDTAQMPVQKQKVAQFNQGSKIYTLNGSNQLSKNNGDGYVITNAGTYNGRAVDIGVTINNVQDNQGSYTTKWSNGDKADVTGKVDNEFNYQNGVTVNSQVVQPIVPSHTRSRTEDQQVSTKVPDYWWHFRYNDNTDGSEADVFFDPVLVTQMSSVWDVNQNDVLHYLVSRYSSDFSIENNWQQYLKNVDFNQVSAITPTLGQDHVFHEDSEYEFTENDGSFTGALTRVHYNSSIAKGYTPKYSENNPYVLSVLGGVSPNGYYIVKSEYNNNDEALNALLSRKKYEPTWNDVLYGGLVSVNSYPITQCDNEAFANFSNSDKHVIITKPVNVTDHLQVGQVNQGSLNYNYTVGLYDAQTGDLITDLKAEYKGKTGVQATASTNVMNSAIKSKIQQINQGKASVSYTGTSANDDVAFYQETRQVNPQDKNVNRQVQRVIHINFPNGVKPASYDSITDSAGNKLTLDSNNNLTQSMSFTRTGTENIVSGQVTYGNWQQHGAINAVTLPAIPGYTMVTTN